MPHVPEPTNWTSRTAVVTAAALFAVAIMAFCVYETATAIGASDTLSAMVAGMFALGIAAFAGSIVSSRMRSRTLRAEMSTTALTLRSDPVAMALTLGALLAMTASSTIFVTGTLLGKHISITPAGREIHAMFLMSCLLLISLLGLVAFARRGRGTYFRLSADQVEYADLIRTRTLSWDRVANILDAAPRSRAHHPIVFALNGAADVLVVPNVDGFAPSGAALYWMVRHYWLHPENRHELENGTALDRLRNCEFQPE